jgi:hypothetical protein
MSHSPRGDLRTDIRAAPGSAGGGATLFGSFWFGPPFPRGTRSLMTDDRIGQRAADLLPEEQVEGGSADPRAQAAAILAESDEREGDLEAAPSSFLEHRSSGEAADNGETTR